MFQITLNRWREPHLTDALTGSTSGTSRDELTLEVRHGLEFVVPERRVFDLGLPVPDGVARVEPQPPTGHFDPALLAGSSHPEVLAADGVLEKMKQWLTGQGLLRPGSDGSGHRPSLLLSAIEASYSPAALLDQFTLLNTTGVTRWLPISSVFGATLYLWTKVTAETLEPMSQHERPEMTMLLRGKAITEKTAGTSRSTEVDVHGEVHGRVSTSKSYGLQVAGGWSRAASSEHELHEESVGVYWGQTRNASVEFQLRQRFRVEMAVTRQLPEVLSAPVRAFYGVTLAVTGLTAGRRHTAARLRRRPSFLARFPQRPEDGVVDGWVRVVVPAHLVRPGQTPQRDADPGEDADPPVWESGEQPLNDALVDLVSEHGHPWALPAAAAVNRWAVLPAAASPSRPRPVAPESWRPDSSTLFGMLYDQLTNEVMMRLSLEPLLRHEYEVLVSGEKVTVGLRIIRLAPLPESDVEILSRHFLQGRDSEEHLSGTASGWFGAVGPTVGGQVHDHPLQDSLPLRYEQRTSGARAAESEEILERNTASVRPFRYYRADVEIALSGSHGKLLVQAPGGLYLMLPVTLADSPVLLEVLATEPESGGPSDNDNDDGNDGTPGAGPTGPASPAERPVDSLVEAFLTRVNAGTASDSHLPDPGSPPRRPRSRRPRTTPAHRSTSRTRQKPPRTARRGFSR